MPCLCWIPLTSFCLKHCPQFSITPCFPSSGALLGCSCHWFIYIFSHLEISLEDATFGNWKIWIKSMSCELSLRIQSVEIVSRKGEVREATDRRLTMHIWELRRPSLYNRPFTGIWFYKFERNFQQPAGKKKKILVLCHPWCFFYFIGKLGFVIFWRLPRYTNCRAWGSNHIFPNQRMAVLLPESRPAT